MEQGDFERLVIGDTGMRVSVCRICMKFIAAAPDPMRLAIAENLHQCAKRASQFRFEQSRKRSVPR